MRRGAATLALFLAVLASGGVSGSPTAGATGLDDYLWANRPLLLFAPTGSDPRVIETLSRIEASRCEFVDRDMVVGLVVAEGVSTLDGRTIDGAESVRLSDRYAVSPDSFAAILIGKDGGEKLRFDDVPDLQRVYAVIDGMPMRGRETGARCGSDG